MAINMEQKLFDLSSYVSNEERNILFPTILKTSIGELDLESFTKERVEKATLTCSTKIHWADINFGFTANDTFYYIDELKVFSCDFLHDQDKIEIWANDNIKIEMKYSSICLLNFEIKQSHVCLIMVLNHTPLFYKEMRQNDRRSKYVRFNPIKDLNDEVYWTAVVESSAFQFEFSLEAVEMASFFKQLHQRVPCPITFEHMNKKPFNYSQMEFLKRIAERLPSVVRYYTEAVRGCGAVGSYFLAYVLKDEKKGYDQCELITLLKCIYQHLRKNISLTSMNFTREFRDYDLGLNYVSIKTVYITPTSFIPTLEDVTMNCRGFKMLDIKNLIQIKFRDEGLNRFPYECADTIREYCEKGIIVGRKNYLEIGGSNSLFRERGTYFYQTEDKFKIFELFENFGDFKQAHEAKLAARIGLYFTSGRILEQCRFAVIPDILSTTVDLAKEPYIFSDGVGLMSLYLAEMIQESMGLPYLPSAVQIRYASFKGLLCLDLNDPRLFNNGGSYVALFRKSQNKFKVNTDGHLYFDVVQCSAPAPFNLHRTFIAMLDAIAVLNGQQEKVRKRLNELHNQACYDIIQPLLEPQAFRDELEKLPKYFPVSKMSIPNLMHDPFLRSMVEAKAVLNAEMLVKKTQIPLPTSHGRTAFGVVDPSGTLKSGEIFFQYSATLSTKSSKKILAEKVGVTRSPINHAGDIRFYKAVDVPVLYHLVDIVVFPGCGDRPHTDEMGGGDCDGDPYAIFWEPDLILDENMPATDFTDLLSKNLNKIELKELPTKHPAFRAKYEGKNNLGFISTTILAHLATQNPQSSEFEKLAKKADVALNYCKSGVAPPPVDDHEKHMLWPTFMDKKHEAAYKTSHILCEMYQDSNDFYQMIKIARKEAEKQRSEMDFLTNIFPCAFAKNMFNEWCNELKALMAETQIKSEGELFSNAFLEIIGILDNNRLPFVNESTEISVIQEKAFAVFKRFRKIILDKFSSTWKDDMNERNEDIFTYKLPIISQAMVDLAKEFYSLAKEAKCCFSFPWLVWEGLDKWWSTSNNENETLIQKLEAEMSLYRVKKYQPYSNYTWFNKFYNFCQLWAKYYELDESILSRKVSNFMDNLEKNLDDFSATSSSEAFLEFLRASVHNKKEETVLSKIDHTTLIEIAFLPNENVLSTFKILRQNVSYHHFTIIVPEYWAEKFSNQYKELEEKTGCVDVAIRDRKTWTFFLGQNRWQKYHYFTIMCSGNLESCQRLESLLIPKIEISFSSSMQNTKMEINEAMLKLFENVLHFSPRPHSKSVPSGLNNQNSSNKKNKKKWTKQRKSDSALVRNDSSQNEFSGMPGGSRPAFGNTKSVKFD